MDGITSEQIDPRLEMAKEFVLKRKSISTPVLMRAMNLNAVQAVSILYQLEQEGIVGRDWNKTLGGFPVLGGGR